MHPALPAGVLVASLVVALAPAQTPVVHWTPLQSGVTVRLRGISSASPQVAWASGGSGTVLRTIDGGDSWQSRPVPGADALDFRDIDAPDATTAVVTSAAPGDGSRIYRTTDGGATWSLRYTAADPAMFLDALAFSDASHGVAFSDAVRGQFVILTTSDGGASWTRVPADRLPPALPNEGAFAASGTNVVARTDGYIWIATTASRVLHTADHGRTWRVTTTPVATGEATGIFSIGMRDARHGVVVGGVYTKESEATDNAAVTADGGVSWQRPTGRGLSGYRSAVASLSALGPRAWLAVGPTGSDTSVDDGQSWHAAGGAGYDAVSVAPDGRTGFASGAGGRLARVTVSR